MIVTVKITISLLKFHGRTTKALGFFFLASSSEINSISSTYIIEASSVQLSLDEGFLPEIKISNVDLFYSNEKPILSFNSHKCFWYSAAMVWEHALRFSSNISVFSASFFARIASSHLEFNQGCDFLILPASSYGIYLQRVNHRTSMKWVADSFALPRPISFSQGFLQARPICTC